MSNEKWRIRTEYANLNKVCPRDSFLFLLIWNVEDVFVEHHNIIKFRPSVTDGVDHHDAIIHDVASFDDNWIETWRRN
ncbi:hypothetical protein CR513_09695, partial [Mucuna pruriens]